MKYSMLPSAVMMELGAAKALSGKSVLSFKKYFFSWLMWNVGKFFKPGGSQSWYEDDSGYTFVISKGLSKHGMNFATLPSFPCM